MTSFLDQPRKPPRMEQLSEEQLRTVGRVEKNPSSVSPMTLGKLDAWAHALPHGEDRDRVERAIARANKPKTKTKKPKTDDEIDEMVAAGVDAAFKRHGLDVD